MDAQVAVLIEKLRQLPAEQLGAVEDFVDSLHRHRPDQMLSRAAAKTSEDAFARVWENPDDAGYDDL